MNLLGCLKRVSVHKLFKTPYILPRIVQEYTTHCNSYMRERDIRYKTTFYENYLKVNECQYFSLYLHPTFESPSHPSHLIHAP
jgi:hypothetical protein